MNGPSSRGIYEARLHRVLAHIDARLSESLALPELAAADARAPGRAGSGRMLGRRPGPAAQSRCFLPRSREPCFSGSTRGSRWHSTQFSKFGIPSLTCFARTLACECSWQP